MKKIFKLIICFFIVYCMITDFTRIKVSVENAVTIWSGVIIPSVFPYIVLAKYICNSGITDVFRVFPGKVICRVFKLSPCSVNAFICSLFCGYPSGAVCAYELCSKGIIKKEEAKRLICFTNNAGPLYLISAVGAGMLGSIKKGLAIYVIHLVSAFIYGAVCSAGKKAVIQLQKSENVKTDFCECVKSGVEVAVNICGFMIVSFVMAQCCIIFWDKIFYETDNFKYLSVLTKGFFEISAGVNSVANMSYSDLNFALICAFVSWSGISVIMQIKSVGENIISLKSIILAKAIQAIISFVMGYLYSGLLNEYKYNFNNTDYLIKISFVIAALVFIYYIFAKKKLSE